MAKTIDIIHIAELEQATDNFFKLLSYEEDYFSEHVALSTPVATAIQKIQQQSHAPTSRYTFAQLIADNYGIKNDNLIPASTAVSEFAATIKQLRRAVNQHPDLSSRHGIIIAELDLYIAVLDYYATDIRDTANLVPTS